MIVVAGTFQIKPEKREEAAKFLLHVVAETKKEAGCIVYDFYADLADANLFHVFEEWESIAHLEAHFKTPHLSELGKLMPDFLAGEANVKKYEVSSIAKL